MITLSEADEVLITITVLIAFCAGFLLCYFVPPKDFQPYHSYVNQPITQSTLDLCNAKILQLENSCRPTVIEREVKYIVECEK